MKEVFADTFYFVALLSPVDAAHELAKMAIPSRPTKLGTTAWVLTEVANSLSRSNTRHGFVSMLRMLQADTSAILIGPEMSIFRDGIRLYEDRTDKDWSLTDYISFVVMEERGITDALTADHHFEQAGFHALLKV